MFDRAVRLIALIFFAWHAAPCVDAADLRPHGESLAGLHILFFGQVEVGLAALAWSQQQRILR